MFGLNRSRRRPVADSSPANQNGKKNSDCGVHLTRPLQFLNFRSFPKQFGRAGAGSGSRKGRPHGRERLSLRLKKAHSCWKRTSASPLFLAPDQNRILRQEGEAKPDFANWRCLGTGAVLGIDVGFSNKRPSSAICRPDWDDQSLCWTIDRFRAATADRQKAFEGVADGILVAAIAFDGPLRRGFDRIGCYRIAERVLTRLRETNATALNSKGPDANFRFRKSEAMEREKEAASREVPLAPARCRKIEVEKLKRRTRDDFNDRHFEAGLIVQAGTSRRRYPLSHRDVESLLSERGLEVDHSTINLWILA
jgi:hypothetical protein